MVASSGNKSGHSRVPCPTDNLGSWSFTCACMGKNKSTTSSATKCGTKFAKRANSLVCCARVTARLNYLICDPSVRSRDGKEIRQKSLTQEEKQMILSRLPPDNSLKLVPYLCLHVNYDHQHDTTAMDAKASASLQDDLRRFAEEQFRNDVSVGAVLGSLISKAQKTHAEAWRRKNPGSVGVPAQVTNQDALNDR